MRATPSTQGKLDDWYMIEEVCEHSGAEGHLINEVVKSSKAMVTSEIVRLIVLLVTFILFSITCSNEPQFYQVLLRCCEGITPFRVMQCIASNI